MRPLRSLALALALALLHSAAGGQQPEPCGLPVARDDGWSIAGPESVGLDPEMLCSLVARLKGAPEANVHAVVIARHGSLAFEQYLTGRDERWGRPLGKVEFGPQTRHDLRSITKSVTSLLVGIAIERGWIAGVDEPVFKFFPEYADLRTPEKDRIRLRHLLTMSAGLVWDEDRPYSDPANSERQMTDATDPYRYALEQPVVAPPGRRYNYSGGATSLLAAVLQKTSGQRLDALARTLLFEPLGITDAEWVTYANGDPVAASGLRLTPRDLAKLGQLVLAGGAWKGRQVVPKAWIEESTAPQIAGADLYYYGYQWWLGRSLIDRREVRWSAGVGYGGQRLFVVPELDLVVAMTAGLYGSPLQRPVTLGVLGDVLAAARRGR